jgi:sec-independent protein translocase protein TatC
MGMLLTPPDVISQVLLALPIWLLFEGGLLASRIIFSDREFDEDDDDDDDEPATGTAVASGSDHAPLSDEEMEAELDQAAADENRIDKP